MTPTEYAPDALESTVPARPDVSEYMEAGRRMTIVAGRVPSQRRLIDDLKIGQPKAREIQRQLILDNPLRPVSGGAPGFDPFTEATGAYPVLPAPLPIAPVQQHHERRHRTQTIALIVPLLLVNSAALYGQAGWAYDHLAPIVALAILFAAAVESIGVYLAAEAHGALMAGDASGRLRFGSYLIGLLVGTLNYAHFASADYRPNPVALTFGLLSSISPWLWSIRSRSMNRDRLRELGQIDPRAVRFSLLRWFMFPIRSWQAFRGAVWSGEVRPAEAVAAADVARAVRIAEHNERWLARQADRAEVKKFRAAPAVADDEPAMPA